MSDDAGARTGSPLLDRYRSGSLRWITVVRLFLAALATMAVAQPGRASVTLGIFPNSIATGLQSFEVTTAPQSALNVTRQVLGQDSATATIANNPSLANIVVASLGFSGQPFTADFSVEGAGSLLVFSETVSVQVEATYNGTMPLGAPQTFSINISGTCGSTTSPDVENICSAEQSFTAFSSSEPVALPPDTPISSVVFNYQVAESNQSCEGEVYSDGVLQSTNLCLQGGTSIFDAGNPGDPVWSASLTVPEPGSISLMAFAVAGLLATTALLRRRRGV